MRAISYGVSKVSFLRFGLLIVGDTPGIRARTIIETDTPGVLCRASDNVCGPCVSTTRPPSVRSGIGKVTRTTGASAVSLGDVGDVNALELLRPLCYLFGVES